MQYIVPLIFVAIIIAGMWKVFTKAGRPGWESIVPIYNYYVMAVEIGKLEIMWFIFMFIPILNIVAAIKICIAVAEKFGKSTGFAVGLVFLGFIFFPILGFGSAQYQKAAAPPVPAPAEQEAPPAPQA